MVRKCAALSGVALIVGALLTLWTPVSRGGFSGNYFPGKPD